VGLFVKRLKPPLTEKEESAASSQNGQTLSEKWLTPRFTAVFQKFLSGAPNHFDNFKTIIQALAFPFPTVEWILVEREREREQKTQKEHH
jgi:hypothetical protein